MTYLLDTNACIALINGRPGQVRARFAQAAAAGATIAVSTIVLFELWYGVARSARREANAERLEAFLAGPLDILPFDEADALRAGTVRGVLQTAGMPIGAYDVLIAGQALNRQATLVTANVSEFARIAGLAWEDWATPV